MQPFSRQAQWVKTPQKENEQIIFKYYYHIGLAIDTDHGLVLPILRDVDQKSITEVAVEITSLAEKARDKKLSPEELEGGCFKVTNLGGIGGTNFTPLIYHPRLLSWEFPAPQSNRYTPTAILSLKACCLSPYPMTIG